MTVERAAEAKALVLKRPSAQPKDTELFEVLGAQLRAHQRLKAQVSRLDQRRERTRLNALAEARIAGKEAVSTWMAF